MSRRAPDRKSNVPVIAGILVVLSIMLGLVAYSPTLYQIFCAVTGFGGTVNRGTIQRTVDAEKVTFADMPVITVKFDSNVDPRLDWEFKPETRSVDVHVGEPKKVYYYARNNTDETIVARAVYNVTPYKVAPYFFKIECFCFVEERLGPGEEARMPLVFYVDKQYMNDEAVQDADVITLSYTFYRQQDLSDEEVKAARDLKRGSEELDRKLKEQDAKAVFENDALRQ